MIEIEPLNRLLDEVSRVFDAKFRDWREENHEASKTLRSLVK